MSFITKILGPLSKYDKSLPLEKEHCLSSNQQWLNRLEICRSLEAYYKINLEKSYKGHVEKEACLFEDRDRRGRGSGIL